MRKLSVLCTLSLGAIISLGAWAQAADNGGQNYEVVAVEAQVLLKKAVARYREIGDPALAEFSRQGDFTTRDLYVYVIDTKGVMLASGGPSSIYIGRNINSLLTGDLKKALAEVLAQPESDAVHSEEYRWTNWADGKVERKRVFSQRVGDKVFAAGYYIPRSSPAEARRLLDDAANAMTQDTTVTVKRINQLDPFFNRDDLYVFVVDIHQDRYVAHGFLPRMLGTRFSTLKSVDGQLIGQQMLDAVKTKTDGAVEYLWRNPVTGTTERKHTLVRRSGNYLVAVGYYTDDKTATPPIGARP
jgi:cytochrome c